ncbi:hypothetical protein B0H14DRAFT_3130379, partial [Mycena olivaceomarginata]
MPRGLELPPMSYDPYATAITDELRSWVHEWLAGIYGSWTLHAVLRLPLPHPTYPLPLAFPFGAFSTWQVFEWIHDYGTNQLRHSYVVCFAFHGRTNGPDSSVVWKIVSEATSSSGYSKSPAPYS